MEFKNALNNISSRMGYTEESVNYKTRTWSHPVGEPR